MSDETPRVIPAQLGRFFEDFEVGTVYQHPFGRTISEAEPGPQLRLLGSEGGAFGIEAQPDHVDPGALHLLDAAGDRQRRRGLAPVERGGSLHGRAA